MINYPKKYIKKFFPWLPEHLSRVKKAQIIRDVAEILSKLNPPQYYDSDKVFEHLQNSYDPRTGYGYDSFSTWERGVQRVQKLLERVASLQTPGISVLYAGCGDGMTGHAFVQYGHKVKLIDFEDWRDPRAKDIPFFCGNLCKQLPFDSNQFDLVCSYNAFEHFNNPEITFKELLRVCKPGGHICLEFGPLYNSSWGLHAYRTITMPYSQFLFSQKKLLFKLNQFGIHDLGKSQTVLQPLNKWSVEQFCSLWNTPVCEIIWLKKIKDFSNLKIIINYPKSFTGLALTLEDVTTNALCAILKKKLG